MKRNTINRDQPIFIQYIRNYTILYTPTCFFLKDDKVQFEGDLVAFSSRSSDHVGASSLCTFNECVCVLCTSVYV